MIKSNRVSNVIADQTIRILLDGPLSDIAEENPWVADPHGKDGIVLLRNM
jgi:hypothetical protein